MSQMIIDSLAGKADLYLALGILGKTCPDVTLPQIMTALRNGDDLAMNTADRLQQVSGGLLRAVLRNGCGLEPIAGAGRVVAFLLSQSPAPLFLPEIQNGPSTALLTQGQRPDMPAFSDPAFDVWFAAQKVPYGLGSYAEPRTVYQTAQFADAASPERRTVHTGIDVFAAPMTPVYAPLAGRVKYVTYNADALDYGHTLILEHDGWEQSFFTLYGHLAATLPTLVAPGDLVTPGQLIGHLGDWHENGGWAAHLHFQIMTDMLEQTAGNFFGVGHPSIWNVWSSICPDPNLVLRLPAARFQFP